jgi:transposase
MKRRKYDREFKQMAVELSNTRDDIGALAKELGIGKDLIYRWRKEAEEHPEESFPGQGNQLLSEGQKQIMKLERELKETQLERDILKKAIGIFSKNDGKYSNS